MNEYIVKPGDTLGRVSYRLFGNAHTYQEWAEYAGLADPNLIEVGQRIPYPGWWARRFRLPLDKTDTGYFKFGDIYPPGHRWAGKPHPGVDFHEVEGAPVYAAGEGVVEVYKDDLYGYGRYMMIRHVDKDGCQWWTLYAHLSYEDGLNWFEGDHVTGVDAIVGHEGMTGAAGGLSHVHFEVKKTNELGLYGELTVDNYRWYYINPYLLEAPESQFLPVQCWGCPHGGAQCGQE